MADGRRHAARSAQPDRERRPRGGHQRRRRPRRGRRPVRLGHLADPGSDARRPERRADGLGDDGPLPGRARHAQHGGQPRHLHVHVAAATGVHRRRHAHRRRHRHARSPCARGLRRECAAQLDPGDRRHQSRRPPGLLHLRFRHVCVHRLRSDAARRGRERESLRRHRGRHQHPRPAGRRLRRPRRRRLRRPRVYQVQFGHHGRHDHRRQPGAAAESRRPALHAPRVVCRSEVSLAVVGNHRHAYRHAARLERRDRQCRRADRPRGDPAGTGGGLGVGHRLGVSGGPHIGGRADQARHRHRGRHGRLRPARRHRRRRPRGHWPRVGFAVARRPRRRDFHDDGHPVGRRRPGLECVVRAARRRHPRRLRRCRHRRHHHQRHGDPGPAPRRPGRSAVGRLVRPRHRLFPADRVRRRHHHRAGDRRRLRR